ncbi:MAG TPA: amino acid ABC transporter permease [Actinocrinis sp.]|nr:amino acid ABC transporter permease [Actinocrinis sp.]
MAATSVTPEIPPETPSATRSGTTAADQELLARRLVPPPRPGRWISAALALLLLAMVVHTVLTNPRFEWSVVGHYFASASIIQGLELTLWLTAAVMACGYALGIALACMRLSTNPILRGFSFLYVWLFRSVPPLVQLLFWYELASFYPQLSLGVPFGPSFVTTNTAHLFSGVVAAFVALSLDVAAFSAEIVRGGILSVDPGQAEAAQALGLGRWRIFRRVVLPQAMPAIVPASGNMLIGTLKATSLVSVIAVADLLYSAQLIYTANFQEIPLLLVASFWYLLLTSVLSIGQYFIERYYSRGSKRRPAARSFRQITRANLPLFPQSSRFGSIGGL